MRQCKCAGVGREQGDFGDLGDRRRRVVRCSCARACIFGGRQRWGVLIDGRSKLVQLVWLCFRYRLLQQRQGRRQAGGRRRYCLCVEGRRRRRRRGKSPRFASPRKRQGQRKNSRRLQAQPSRRREFASASLLVELWSLGGLGFQSAQLKPQSPALAHCHSSPERLPRLRTQTCQRERERDRIEREREPNPCARGNGAGMLSAC